MQAEDDSKVVLLFGKAMPPICMFKVTISPTLQVGTNKFVLDYSRPLGAVQDGMPARAGKNQQERDRERNGKVARSRSSRPCRVALQAFAAALSATHWK